MRDVDHVENILMHSVILKKYDTCYTYVLKRLGLERFMDVESDDFINLSEMSVLVNTIPVYGDILFWDDGSRTYYPNEINVDGVIISNKWNTGLHFAVVEKNGYISDCTKEDTENVYPVLRLRRFSDIHNKPKVIHFDSNRY